MKNKDLITLLGMVLCCCSNLLVFSQNKSLLEVEVLSAKFNSKSRNLVIRGEIKNTSDANYLLYSFPGFNNPKGINDTCCQNDRVSAGFRIVLFQKSKLIYQNFLLGHFYPKLVPRLSNLFSHKKGVLLLKKKSSEFFTIKYDIHEYELSEGEFSVQLVYLINRIYAREQDKQMMEKEYCAESFLGCVKSNTINLIDSNGYSNEDRFKKLRRESIFIMKKRAFVQ